MKSLAITAALTLSLTGKYERQGTEAAEGVRLWADEAGIQLTLIDDHSSKARSVDAYAGWVDGVDLLARTPADWCARSPHWSATQGESSGTGAVQPTTWRNRE